MVSKKAGPKGKAKRASSKGTRPSAKSDAKGVTAKSTRGAASSAKAPSRPAKGSARSTGTDKVPKPSGGRKAGKGTKAAKSTEGARSRKGSKDVGAETTSRSRRPKAAASRARGRGASRASGSRRSGAPRPPRAAETTATAAPFVPVATLTDEEQIESSKYLPRDLPPRLFEEERFLFPETYGVNRVRLLVKDPEWIFAHWDVDPRTMEALRGELGGRMVDVSRLTLRMKDPGDGAVTVTLLPPGARSWYFRVSPLRRSYRADLGFTLPSGEFRLLAESNMVLTPRVGPSSERAGRRVSYARLRAAGSLPPGGLGTARGFTDLSSPPAPVAPTRVADAGAGADSQPSGVFVPGERGGASDVYRR